MTNRDEIKGCLEFSAEDILKEYSFLTGYEVNSIDKGDCITYVVTFKANEFVDLGLKDNKKNEIGFITEVATNENLKMFKQHYIEPMLQRLRTQLNKAIIKQGSK
jgi:hypothetical protein